MLNYLTSSLHAVGSFSLLSSVHVHDVSSGYIPILGETPKYDTMTHRLFSKYLIDLAAQTGPRPKGSLSKI